jgi:hypothetical protein
MGGQSVPVHYLRANEKTWSPSHIITLDTETRTINVGSDEILVLRCWHGRLADRRATEQGKTARDQASGDSAKALAAQVDAWCRGRRTTWLYAHNLSFDLVTTRLPILLTELGWTVTEAAVDSKCTFVRLAKNNKRLTMADSWSLLPVALDKVAQAVNIVKPPLPGENDGMDEWMQRCSADTAILEWALLEMMDYWDAHQLGMWCLTGGNTGWHAFRHIPSPWKILIDPDPDDIAADRKAVYGGRRTVWRVGDMPAGEYLEMDFEKAYTVTAASLPLPIKRNNAFDSLPVDTWIVGSGRWGIIARVRIRTDKPRWPVRLGGRVWYPVGEFWTTLADPDIAEARQLGCLLEIGPGHVHRLGYAMQNWASWCLDLQADQTGQVPEVVKIAAKHWGRAVIGKWAQKRYTRVKLGPAPTDTWGYEDAWNHSEGVKGSIVDIAGHRWWTYATDNADNAYPAVLAFVESYVRVRLGRVADLIGDDLIVQCDTDGLITAGIPASRTAAIDEQSAPLHLRLKRTYAGIRVLGPQHYTADGTNRFSGIPRSAQADGEDRFKARIWPKLAWQMAHGNDLGYVRPEQNYHLKGPYAAGWITRVRRVLPVEMHIGEDGDTDITSWDWTRYPAMGYELADRQNAELEVKR